MSALWSTSSHCVFSGVMELEVSLLELELEVGRPSRVIRSSLCRPAGLRTAASSGRRARSAEGRLESGMCRVGNTPGVVLLVQWS